MITYLQNADGDQNLTFTADAATDATHVTTAKGSYVGVVSYVGDGVTLSKTFVTTVQEPGDEVDSYKMVLDKTAVDAVITPEATADTTVTAAVIGYDGGIKRKIYTDSVSATDWVLKTGNTPVTSDATGDAIDETIAINDISAGDRMAAKTYNFSAAFLCGDGDVYEGIEKTVYGSFTVSDSQHTPTVILDNDGKITGTTTPDNIITAYYYSTTDGNTCVPSTITTNETGVTTPTNLYDAVAAATGSKSVMVYTVKVTTTFGTANANGQYNKVNSTVTLNHTVSKDGNW